MDPGAALTFVSSGFGTCSNVFAAILNLRIGALDVVPILSAVITLALPIYWLVLASSGEG